MDDCAAGWRHRWALAHLRDVTFTAARLTHVVIIIIGWLLSAGRWLLLINAINLECIVRIETRLQKATPR